VTIAAAGSMAKVWGWAAARVGDPIGDAPDDPPGHRFPLPTLESVVAARRPDQSGSLRAALGQLAEQDPLINVRQDDTRHEISVSLYGEVQKEVIAATLEREYGIEADFHETTTLCIERPARTGQAEEIIRAKTKPNITGRSSPLSENPFPATLTLRIEPAPPGSGIAFAMDVEVRLVPLYIFRTVATFAAQMEASVREALAEGLSGWPVTDCRVTLTDCGYAAPLTTAADFRRLTQLVLAAALDRAGSWVCEPLARLALEVPTPSAPAVLALLGRLGGRVTGQVAVAGLSRIGGVLAVGRVRGVQQRLSGLTGGEGVMDVQFGGYQPVGDHPPRRARTTPDPLNRDEFLMALARRG
jgi:ribosomal protection tetracycline resistance protein